MKRDPFSERLLELGDLARERLASSRQAPVGMSQVFAAEEAVLARRRELESLEQKMNREDEAFRAYQVQVAEETGQQTQILKRWKKVLGDLDKQVRETRNAIERKQQEV